MTDKNLAKIDALAGEFHEELRKIHPANVRPMRGPHLPDYVDHHPGVDDVGRLSAEALAMTYEQAAQDIEAMGKALIEEIRSSEIQVLDTVRGLERQKSIAQQSVDECTRAAKIFRSEAKSLFEHIQSRAMAAENVKQLALEMVNKIKIA